MIVGCCPHPQILIIMTVLLFANGDLEEIGWIRPYLAAATAVIAADGGTKHLWRLGHLPDVVVGDMDSLPKQARQWLAAAKVPLIVAPVNKDETDLELALLHAVTHFKEDILIFAGFGGRLDQTLANILLLAHPSLVACSIELLTPYERAWLVTTETEIRGEAGDTVSLIPLGGEVLVRQTTGLQWPLKDEILTFGPARGVSNTMTAAAATVSIESGPLLCIHTRQAWQR
jgi:thiamine pyrophosphokinase